MTKANSHMTCHCCGAAITAPQFYNGKAYGWSCVLKQAPSYKRTRNVGFWVKADTVTFTKDDSSNRFKVTATLNGTAFTEFAYVDLEHYKETSQERPVLKKNIRDGLIRISESNNGSNCIWKQTHVKTKLDSKNKLQPVAIESHTRQGTTILWSDNNA